MLRVAWKVMFSFKHKCMREETHTYIHTTKCKTKINANKDSSKNVTNWWTKSLSSLASAIFLLACKKKKVKGLEGCATMHT